MKTTRLNLEDYIKGDYDVLRDSWYSPIEIISRFEQLRHVYGSQILKKSEFKRARELFVGAVSLLGAYELHPQNKYWLQSNRQSTSPDVVGAKQIEHEGGILLEQTMIEVVDFEEHHPSNDIVEFLLETKLSKKYAYSEHTAIVMMVNKVVPFNLQQVHARLENITIKPSIYIIGRPKDSEKGIFTISTVNPPVLKRPILFNIVETASKYSIPPRIQFHKGIEKEIVYTKEIMSPVNTYNVMGLDQKKIEAKYPRIGH
ncbi:hypothetical protein KC721_01060 [Candidatus Woesebacteria bacterium]|nr:hypothetical protein [Candidatus Woesebacteria bacterium]